MKYRNDVIRSFFLVHIRANLGMMLARDTGSCHATRSTVVMFVAKHVQKLIWPAKVGPIETQSSSRSAATKSHGAHACYSSDVCGYSTTVYL